MSDSNGQVRNWLLVECDDNMVEKLTHETGLSPIISRILVNRGITSMSEAEEFLNPSLTHLHDPSLLPDMDVGVELVAEAVVAGKKMLVHGDYDVDGVTSAALLVRSLRALNANVAYRLPHRQKEGYDIKPATIDEAAESGVSLIVTCDCGISAIEAVKHANELGIDVVITDHHEPGPILPDAKAIINPKRHDAAYPFPELAGVGVAFKFAQAIVRRLGFKEESFISKFIDLAALGTVGDVVPLLGENRAIVKYGLQAIPKSKKLGLQTMLRSTNLVGKQLTAYYLGFVLGPRINSVGRMDDASLALKLFLTSDNDEAIALASEMERCNAERKVEQERILAEAIVQAESKNLDNIRVLVLSSEGWNTGVVGIVAGRICEMFGRPAILIGRDEQSGIGHGSARSIAAFNIVEGLQHCHDLLGRFGGHALAAGLSIPLCNIDAFEAGINRLAADIIRDEDMVAAVLVDAELAPGDISHELACNIAGMEPFGMGNPEPLFMTRGLSVIHRQRVGDGSHLKMQVGCENGAPINCIAFGMGDYADVLEQGSLVDMCYNVRLNRFNGAETVQLVGKAIRPSS